MSVMRYILFVFFQLLLISAPVFSSETTLAVLDFENNSFFNPEEYHPLSKGLAEMMITEMNQVQAIRVVERRKLRSLLDELKLTQSGVLLEESSVRVGQLLGAQHLVFGGYMVTMNEKIRIDVRIVEVETGLTVKAGEVTGKTKQVLSLIKKLSKKILKDLNVRMTKNEKRSFEKSQKLNMKAVILFSKGLEFEDRGQWVEAKQCYQKSLDIEPQFQQARVRIQELADREKNF